MNKNRRVDGNDTKRREGAEPAAGDAAVSNDDTDGAAHRLIVRLWRQRQELRANGRTPQRVVLSMHNYRVLQTYHAQLGELPNPNIDYITRYTVFDLPVYIDATIDCNVE